MIRQAFRNIMQIFVTLMVFLALLWVVAAGIVGCIVWDFYKAGGREGLEQRIQEQYENRYEYQTISRDQIPQMPTPREVFEKHGIENWGVPE